MRSDTSADLALLTEQRYSAAVAAERDSNTAQFEKLDNNDF